MMTGNPHTQLGETVPRMVVHWIASCFGHFLMVLLPLIAEWPYRVDPVFPRWWSVLLFAGITSVTAAIINANLPVTARELIKSVALGFALNATAAALHFT
ncbi:MULTISPECIES: hypothetical protein [unclassified Sphingomonas]|nr:MULTISPECIES: hypothetical protein [unclassified Sphingomonas]KQN39710.1 hypothetical protein ASE97_06575 [Sphingomonas sp. Leaf42]KQT28985.1 hypothetical protein ASG37_09285 [Sphingomonas sp. Leaf407]